MCFILNTVFLQNLAQFIVAMLIIVVVIILQNTKPQSKPQAWQEHRLEMKVEVAGHSARQGLAKGWEEGPLDSEEVGIQMKSE